MNRLTDWILSLTKEEKLSSIHFNIIRVSVAVLIFLLCVCFHITGFLRGLFLALSLIISGYDLAIYSVNAVQKKQYLSEPVIILFVIVISFVTGYRTDAAAAILLYQIGHILFDYVAGKTKSSAVELAKYQTKETQDLVWDILNRPGAGTMDVEYVMASSANPILRLALLVALLYVILIPIITSISFGTALHRSLMMLIISIPSSITLSIPLVGLIGIGYASQKGILIKNAAALEKFSKVKTVILEKHGVLQTETPRVLTVESNIIDKKTFINFASHAVYYSNQPFAKAIGQYHSGELTMLDLVSDFREIDGGVELRVNGMEVILATLTGFAKKAIEQPEDNSSMGIPYYMTVSGRYVGKILISEEIGSKSVDFVEQMHKSGMKKFILFSDESKTQSEKIAEELNIDTFYSNCDNIDKQAVISEITNKSTGDVMYVYSDGIENHSDANLDCRVGTRGKYADVIILPEFIANLPEVMHIADRVKFVSTENAVFAFSIKAFLIFLAINGFTTLWFTVFIDTVAVLATMLNAIRVTGETFFDSLRVR